MPNYTNEEIAQIKKTAYERGYEVGYEDAKRQYENSFRR